MPCVASIAFGMSYLHISHIYISIVKKSPIKKISHTSKKSDFFTYTNSERKSPIYILQGENNMKKVKCIETQVIYNSAREAGEQLNISYKTISKCINGKSKSAGGFHFVAISESDILPQATNQISDIPQKSPSDKNKEKVAYEKKSPIAKVANEDTSDILEKSPLEKSPKKVPLEKSPLEKSPSDKSDILESEKQATNSTNNKNDWFTKELEAENQTTKIDTELIESIIMPCEDNVEPLIDKDALLLKYERERIDRQLKKYIKLPLAHELKEQMILAFYSYVKKYSSSYVDKIKEMEQENKSLQENNDSLIDKLSTYKSKKDAFNYLQQEYENVINDKSGSYVSEAINKQRKSIEKLQQENYKYQCEIDALKKKLESNWGDFTVEYERDTLLKKVAELEEQLKEQLKVADMKKSPSDISDVQKVANEDDTKRKKSPSEMSRTFDRPSINPHLSDTGQIKSSVKRIKDEEELTWDDI